MKRYLILLACLLYSFSIFSSTKIIIGDDEIEKLKDLDTKSQIYLNSRPTGRLKLPGTIGIPDYCTVSLISANRIITAAHCLRKKPAISKLKVYFDYYTKATKKINPYQVTKIISVNKQDDRAILELAGNPGLKYGFYKMAKYFPKIGDNLLIYQHPGLDMKSISRISCSFVGMRKGLFFHNCDTQNYSSGSPILNEHFEIIAVHAGAMITMNDTLNYGVVVQY